MSLDPTTDASFENFLPGRNVEDDRSLIVRFFLQKKLMGAKSLEAGREIYEDREFIEIKIKGQPHQIVVEEVKDTHRQKFPIAYAAFKQSMPVPVVGTPIEQLPGVGPSMAHSLRGLNLRTVEDVSYVTDEATLQRMGMGARELVSRAKAWLEQKSPAELALAEENKMLRAQLEQVNDRFAALEARLGAAPVKRGSKKAAEAAAAQVS